MVTPGTQKLAAWATFAVSVALVLASLPLTILVLPGVDAATSESRWVTGFAGLALNIVFLAIPVTGIVIARRQPGNRIAWILLVIGVVLGVGSMAEPYANYGVALHPGSLPAADVVAAINGSLWVPAIGLTATFLILLFPDGRLPSRRWRPVAWLSALTIALFVLTFVFGPERLELQNSNVANPLRIEAVGPFLSVALFALPLLPLCMLLCAVSLVLRFRRSRGIERLQVKWLASAAAVVALVYLVGMLLSGSHSLSETPTPSWLDTYDKVSVLSFVLIPVAIGIAVLKYGLYGIDRLISRTLSYVVITGTLLAVYLVLVTTVSRIAPASNSLAVAASTLTVAALFQPLRRRVQSAVDRRFNRSRYDADRTVETFTRTLRQEVNLDAVSSDLVATVHETLEPAQVGLWLRPGRDAS